MATKPEQIVRSLFDGYGVPNKIDSELLGQAGHPLARVQDRGLRLQLFLAPARMPPAAACATLGSRSG
jgi:hypothetical protein